MDAAGTAYLSGWLPLGLLPVRHGSMCPFEAFEQLFTACAGWYGARNAPLGAASPATSIAAVYRPGPWSTMGSTGGSGSVLVRRRSW